MVAARIDHRPVAHSPAPTLGPAGKPAGPSRTSHLKSASSLITDAGPRLQVSAPAFGPQFRPPVEDKDHQDALKGPDKKRNGSEARQTPEARVQNPKIYFKRREDEFKREKRGLNFKNEK
ncbi:hypothetical protein E4633_13970 [Geomonas terrae]|uniref:Uncharacterized protein n=1 Tax=Geomonas terrae TaxID=2562681 RepID=A0A4S1CEH8_9BACT|nr:hypothetical protein [Geomonas terrae]TGU71430.1 hypothetical protein E4633_13970 [Geomonas terrae]